MILGIETSCDETSVALLGDDGSVRVNLIASQIERHQPFGGVVPEIASREHLLHLFPLVTRADLQKILSQHVELYEALLRLHSRRIRTGNFLENHHLLRQ